MAGEVRRGYSIHNGQVSLFTHDEHGEILEYLEYSDELYAEIARECEVEIQPER